MPALVTCSGSLKQKPEPGWASLSGMETTIIPGTFCIGRRTTSNVMPSEVAYRSGGVYDGPVVDGGIGGTCKGEGISAKMEAVVHAVVFMRV